MNIALPTRNGFIVMWYTGKVETYSGRKGKIKSRRITDSYENTSKQAVENKKAELENAGLEIIGMYECVM